jgi:hypothetical protein
MGLLARLGLRSPEQATPSTPPTGQRALYAKTGGWYDMSSAGVETLLATKGYVDGLARVVVTPYSYSGTLVVTTGKFRWYNDTGRTLTITAVRASVGTVPAGTAVIVDVNKNGVTVYTTQANRPTIAIGGTTATANNPDAASVAAGDYLTVDIDQIGSTTAGADLTVTVVMA